jgi:hypothetical protein
MIINHTLTLARNTSHVPAHDSIGHGRQIPVDPSSLLPQFPCLNDGSGVTTVCRLATCSRRGDFLPSSRGEPPSFARREPAREGLETLPGFPC